MHTISVHLNINEPSLMKRQYDIFCANKCQICLSQILSTTRAFYDILFIPGGGDSECINLTDDLQLSSNHNRSITRVILQGLNIYDILYL